MKPPVVHIATSAGGHIELATAVRSAFAGYRCVWVVQPSLRASLLAREGEEVIELPQYDRHRGSGHFVRGRFLKNIVQSAGIVLRQRPRVVMTPGSGATVPFCLLAWSLGARIVFVETMARVTGPSSSGKVLSRLATRVLVQWPELAGSYPRATVCQPALLRSMSGSKAPPGNGVFVGVGTHSQPFDRLLALVDEAAGRGILPSPLVVQGGPSTYRPRHFRLRAWLSPEEVAGAIGRAEYVICHAGSGLLSGALRAGRRPLVLARLACHGEHYDDHQTQIVAKLADLGLAVPLQDEIRAEDLAAARAPLSPSSTWALEPHIEEALRAELAAAVGPAGPGRAEQAATEGAHTVESITAQRRIT